MTTSSLSVDYEVQRRAGTHDEDQDGARTNLSPTYLEHTATAFHFSANRSSGSVEPRPRRTARAADPGSGCLGKVFAIELKDHPRVIDIAHHHVIHDEYWTEPHASVNRDFTKIVFGSNWDVASKTDIDTYLVELPKVLTAH